MLRQTYTHRRHRIACTRARHSFARSSQPCGQGCATDGSRVAAARGAPGCDAELGTHTHSRASHTHTHTQTHIHTHARTYHPYTTHTHTHPTRTHRVVTRRARGRANWLKCTFTLHPRRLHNETRRRRSRSVFLPLEYANAKKGDGASRRLFIFFFFRWIITAREIK